MPGGTRRFRLFVSSTFRDFVAEREALRRNVYPRLRRRCEAQGGTFEAVDLRWGVSREAAEHQRTMAICLEEVDRCARTTERPNFLLLLGDRLGWRPLPAEIQADLLADLGRLLGGDPAHARAAELLNEWYGHTRDDNAVPPVHHLGPAERAAADEVTLRRALESVLGDVTPEVHATLVGGATEQEVRRRLALGPIDGGRAVIAIRQIRDLPDSPEATAFADLDAGGRPDGSARSRHRKLQTELESVAGVDRLAYEARWLGSDISSTHIESLCNDVHDRLSVAIRSELSPPTGAGPHAREDGLHASFAATRSRDFRGRAEELIQLQTWLDGPGGRPLVIHGPSGSGKTTLIAHVLTSSISQQAQEIVARFVGATASSSNPRLLLRDLCLLLAELEAESGYSVPERLGDLVTDFRRLLVAWPTDRTLLLIIDALAEEAWAWLNDELPASVHLLVSVLDGSDLDLIGRLAPRSELLDVGRMRTGDAGKALDAWLAAASPSRTLQPSQRNAVLEAFDHTGLPLHLRLLYEQARRWTSDHRPGELPSSVEATIDRLFDTLSEPTEHGPVVVGAALSYLAAARDGLTSTEFVDVLSLDAETMQDFRARQPLDSPSTDILPAIVWTRLLFDLDAYLTERDRLGTPTLDFFHRQFRDVVVRRWLAASSGNLVHSRLAAYFAGLDTWLRNGVAAVPNRRKLAELPYQYTEAGQWVAAEALLTDPDVLRALVEGLGPGELVDDLDRILEPSRLPEVEAQLGGVKHLRALRRAASASSPIVSADPSQLPSQLCGRIGTEYESLRHRLRGWKGQAWLEPLRPTLEAGALRFVLSGHRGSVRSVAVSKDSRWCATAGNSTPDRTIRVWSLERGTQLRVLEDLAEAGKETPLAFDSTGALLVGRGQELFVVDVLVGRIERALVTDGDHVACLAAAANVPVAVAGAGRMLYVCLPGLGDEAKLIDVGNAVAKVAVTHDGRQVAALTAKGVLLFDLDELSELARCEREIDVGTGFWDRPPLALSPTGDTVSFGRDLLRWHPATGEVEEVIASAQADSMDAPRAVLAITPDGKQALVSPSSDDMRDRALSSDQSCSIAAWSPGPGPAGPAIKGPGAQISATAITSDGEVAVVAYYDHSVRVWELQRATDSSLSAHDNPVRSIVVDGELAVTIDQGNIVLFWSLSTGQPVDQRETRFSEQSLDDLIALFERTEAQLDVLDPPGSRFSAYRWVISAGGRRAVRYAVSTAKLSEEPDPADLSDREGQPMPFDVWDLDLEGRPVERRHEGRGELDSRLNRVVVSPDGRKAIAAGWGSLRVFDLELGRQLFRLIGHTGPVWDVALAGGGQLAMSAAEDATVRLWDIETGLCVATFTGDSPMRVCEATVLAGDATPTCVAGEDSGRVHILRLRPTDLQAGR